MWAVFNFKKFAFCFHSQPRSLDRRLSKRQREAMSAAKKNISTQRLGFLVVVVWFLFLVLQTKFSLRIPSDNGGQLSKTVGGGLQVGSAHRMDDKTFDSTRVVFLISMGEEAQKSKMVERFVWSARNRGEWQGYIVLLTDAPIDRYAGFSHRFLVMNPKPGHLDTRFKEDMPYKRFKTMLIDYIDEDDRLKNVRLIYYLDVDNIIGNSLPNMFRDLEIKYNIPGKSEWLHNIPRVWFFANKYANKSVQGGQFVVDRYSSKDCLLAWRAIIDANVSEPKDQPALHQIRGNGRNQDCQIVTMLSHYYISYPVNKTVRQGRFSTKPNCT